MTATQETYLSGLLRRTELFKEEQVAALLEAARKEDVGVVQIAAREGMASETDFLQALAKAMRLAYVHPVPVPPPEVLPLLPAKAVFQYNVLPIANENGALVVAANDPLNTGLVDALRLASGMRVRLALTPLEDLKKATRKYYGVGAETVEQMLEDGRYDVDEASSKADLSELGQEASIVNFVNQIIAEADRQGSTDIHFEPMEKELRIRYRIDGVLHKVDVPAQLHRFQSAIISRIKVMANLDIAEKRLPMDGRIGIRVGGDDIDIRVSTMPTVYGESVSLRLLQKQADFVGLTELGFNDRDIRLVRRLIDRPNGIILATGPTGSGKSTSLYAFLHEINKEDVRILTAEEPIEYEMRGVNQVLVRPEIGLTFARVLRSFLRQDPDIIMVGEIRDRETAEIAINASLTGHLVFSTLHTNDAAGAFTRLTDMGVEPFLIASSVAGVLAQRLVRRLCKVCRKPVLPEAAFLRDAGFPVESLAGRTIYEPTGCDKCVNTGFRGRGGIFELLHVSEAIESLIIAHATMHAIKQKAIEEGMTTLRDDGWNKVLSGVTTIEEVVRATEENE